MAKIYAPNEAYTGVTATVAFANGVGQVDDSNEHLITMFTEWGYRVELEAVPEPEASAKKTKTTASAEPQ